jgi:hypothetical protein
MASEAILRIKVIADTAAAAAGLDNVAGKGGRFGSAMKKAAVPALAIVGAIGLGAKAAIDAASDYQQAQGAVDAVFGKQAKAVEALSKTSADRLGLAGSDYLNYAALVGGALQNAGFSTEQAVGKQDKLLTRAADLASTYGGTTADAVDAINAAISRSEFDPLEKFNVSLNMTAVNAELAKRGQDKLTGAALSHAKAQIVMEEIYKKSSKAAGQFARESDTAAGQQQRAAAAAKDAGAALGTALLPAYTKAMQLLAQFAKWAAKNKTAVMVMVGALGVLAVAVIAVNIALTILALNPVSLVIIGIVAAVAALAIGFTILYKRSEKFRNVANAVFGMVKQYVTTAARQIAAVWRVTIAVITGGARAFGRAWSAVVAAVRAVATRVASSVRAVFSAVWRFLSAAARAYLGAVRAVLGGVRSVAASVAGFVRAVWSRVWSAVVAGARTVGRGISSALSSARSTVASVVAFIRSKFSSLWGAVAAGARGLGAALSAPFNTVRGVIDSVISAVGRLISALSRIKVPHISIPKLGKAGPAASSASATVPGVGVRGLSAGTLAAPASGGVVINISGALDPEGVARQVQRLLDGHDRRVGKGVVIVR